MFIFEKRTQIPVVIKNRNPKLASYILSQYGGPDGELGPPSFDSGLHRLTRGQLQH